MVKSYAIIFSILLALSLSMLPNIGYGQGGVRNRPTISKDVGVGPGLEAAATPEILKNVGVEQNIGNLLPLGQNFYNEKGELVKLSSFFNNKPVILSMVYYDCPMLCTEILNGLNRSLAPLKFTIGDEFEVISVSFDPTENYELAAEKKALYTQRYNRSGAQKGWHFLTAEAPAIDKLAKTVGFNYVYDESTGEFVHGSAIMVITPTGKVSHYFFGIEYPSEDIRLALVESSEDKLGNIFDQVMLYCFNYDPEQGRYGIVIMNTIRVAGLFTLLAMGSFMIIMFKRDRRKRKIKKQSDN
tara:strand:- start:141482 stop:142378 length:897 start_codon:yes stop_codon:yes gene_type:complete